MRGPQGVDPVFGRSQTDIDDVGAIQEILNAIRRNGQSQTRSDGQGDLETNCGGEPQYVACSC